MVQSRFAARVRQFKQGAWSARLHWLAGLWRKLRSRLFIAPLFGQVGRGSVIHSPAMLVNTEWACIGERVVIRYGARIEVVLHGQDWTPSLQIGNDVNIEQNVHIVCHDSIVIEDGVSITGHCAIVDVTHPVQALAEGRKMGTEVDKARSHVRIGCNTFVGFGSIILPNVTIGRDCMIGAGSVVSRNIPDGSIAAGVPARVIGRTTRNGLTPT
jgi:acetyltransferase-like isoleucine patch superfamily enzyme